MIIDERQKQAISERGDLNQLGVWASEDKLPDSVQPARDATGVKKQWKDDSMGDLYKVELEVKKDSPGIQTRRGEAGPVFDEDLGQKLPAGNIQHEIIEKTEAAKNLEVKKITPLEPEE